MLFHHFSLAVAVLVTGIYQLRATEEGDDELLGSGSQLDVFLESVSTVPMATSTDVFLLLPVSTLDFDPMTSELVLFPALSSTNILGMEIFPESTQISGTDLDPFPTDSMSLADILTSSETPPLSITPPLLMTTPPLEPDETSAVFLLEPSLTNLLPESIISPSLTTPTTSISMLMSITLSSSLSSLSPSPSPLSPLTTTITSGNSNFLLPFATSEVNDLPVTTLFPSLSPLPLATPTPFSPLSSLPLSSPTAEVGPVPSDMFQDITASISDIEGATTPTPSPHPSMVSVTMMTALTTPILPDEASSVVTDERTSTPLVYDAPSAATETTILLEEIFGFSTLLTTGPTPLITSPTPISASPTSFAMAMSLAPVESQTDEVLTPSILMPRPTVSEREELIQSSEREELIQPSLMPSPMISNGVDPFSVMLTPSNIDLIPLTLTPSDIEPLSGTSDLFDIDPTRLTLMSSDIELAPTPSGTSDQFDIDPTQLTLMSSDVDLIPLTLTPSGTSDQFDIDPTQLTLTSSDIVLIPLTQTPSGTSISDLFVIDPTLLRLTSSDIDMIPLTLTPSGTSDLDSTRLTLMPSNIDLIPAPSGTSDLLDIDQSSLILTPSDIDLIPLTLTTSGTSDQFDIDLTQLTPASSNIDLIPLTLTPSGTSDQFDIDPTQLTLTSSDIDLIPLTLTPSGTSDLFDIDPTQLTPTSSDIDLIPLTLTPLGTSDLDSTRLTLTPSDIDLIPLIPTPSRISDLLDVDQSSLIPTPSDIDPIPLTMTPSEASDLLDVDPTLLTLTPSDIDLILLTLTPSETSDLKSDMTTLVPSLQETPSPDATMAPSLQALDSSTMAPSLQVLDSSTMAPSLQETPSPDATTMAPLFQGTPSLDATVAPSLDSSTMAPSLQVLDSSTMAPSLQETPSLDATIAPSLQALDSSTMAPSLQETPSPDATTMAPSFQGTPSFDATMAPSLQALDSSTMAPSLQETPSPDATTMAPSFQGTPSFDATMAPSLQALDSSTMAPSLQGTPSPDVTTMAPSIQGTPSPDATTMAPSIQETPLPDASTMAPSIQETPLPDATTMAPSIQGTPQPSSLSIPLSPQISSDITSSSPFTLSPVTTPPPSACPSLLTDATPPIEQIHLINIGLALTTTEHAALTTPNSPKQCSLEAAFTGIFTTGRGIAGGERKRQIGGAGYDADISLVGDLSIGSSLITFFVLNATDQNSSPVPVPAAVVVMAFSDANVQAVDSYPIILPPLPSEVTTTTNTNSSPVNSDLIPLLAGLGGAVIFLLLVIIVVCIISISCFSKTKQTSQPATSVEGGQAFSDSSREFSTYHRSNSVAIQHGTPTLRRAGERQERVSLAQLSSNGWVEGMEQDEQETRGRQALPVEHMAHYDTHSQTGPSPLIRGLRKHIRNSVLPSNSVSNTSDEGVSTPDALRPSSRAAEAKKLREEALRLQEKQEEQELKLRRKATLERLLDQSRFHDGGGGGGRSRRKRRSSVVPMATGESPDWSQGGQSLDDTSSPLATPHTEPPVGSSSGPSTKRRVLKKSNRVSPHDNGITDHHDSDHRHRKSRPLKRQKSGRSQRGRPFTQSNLVGGGRVSRGTAYEAQQELAWLDTGVGGVKLMRYQPLPPTTPTFSSSLPPPHPQPPLIQVQPHPQPQAERLPTITSLQSHSYTQRQLETYFKIHQEMEKLHLHHSTVPISSSQLETTPPDWQEATHPSPHETSVSSASGGEEGAESAAVEDRASKVIISPATPSTPGPPPDTPLPVENSSHSTIHDLMQRVYSSPHPMSTPLPMATPATPHPMASPHPMATQYQLYAPPSLSYPPPPHPHATPRTLVWAPTDTQPMDTSTPGHTHTYAQSFTPAELTHMRHNLDYSNHDYGNQGIQWSVENYPHQMRHLPSHSQVRNYRDPFQQ